MVIRINVDPNPEIRNIVSTGANVLPQIVFEQAVRGLLGKTMNYNTFEAAVKKINNWYVKEGIFGEVRAFMKLTFNDVRT